GPPRRAGRAGRGRRGARRQPLRSAARPRIFGGDGAVDRRRGEVRRRPAVHGAGRSAGSRRPRRRGDAPRRAALSGAAADRHDRAPGGAVPGREWHGRLRQTVRHRGAARQDRGAPRPPGRVVTARDARILVVDDNVALLDNLQSILEEEGYRVQTAATGADALGKAKPGFAVALVDLRLPDSSGTALAVQLKEISPGGEIVLLTGFATLETAIGAVRAGAFAYLVKPCSTADLLLTIEQALRQVRLHAEKRELSRRAQVAE